MMFLPNSPKQMDFAMKELLKYPNVVLDGYLTLRQKNRESMSLI